MSAFYKIEAAALQGEDITIRFSEEKLKIILCIVIEFIRFIN
jgi:hypothetical protein